MKIEDVELHTKNKRLPSIIKGKIKKIEITNYGMKLTYKDGHWYRYKLFDTDINTDENNDINSKKECIRTGRCRYKR